jgi:chorismate lyase
MLLLGDGSPTRHLQLLTGEATAVDVIDMSITNSVPPEAIDYIGEPRILRQVWLRTVSGKRLAYAASWWAANQVDQYLENRSLPIWDSLSQLHTELYRDIRGLYCGYSEQLAQNFAQNGPFWGRHYLFWHNQRPLTLIYEVFSPTLRQYLGELNSGMNLG